MRVAFYHGPEESWFGRGVAFLTKGPFTHVELLFSDGMCFSSTENEGGCRFKKIDMDFSRWVILEIDCPEDKIRKFCEQREFCKYDWFGLLGFILRRNTDRKNRYYCSEVCAEAMSIEGVIKFKPLLSPNTLYWKLKRSGRVTREIMKPAFLTCCI
ncbi:MAG: hypothetical protein HC888_04590 [Candidatus Competibacteraceae bacterium]|nr:hypothetical protein [Candidatus Competibacteraceae bacterium]